MIQERAVIKFTFEEVEALLRLLQDIKEEEMTREEKLAKEKLKRIYARQILSNERKQRNESNNIRLADTK